MRFHHLTSSFATTAGRLVVPMRSLATKLLAVTAIFVVIGTTALAPSAVAWSSDDDTVAITHAGPGYGNTRDVAVADDGSFYACGHFRATVVLDPDNTVSVPDGSTQSGLIVKMNPEGNYEWHAPVDMPNGSVVSCVVAGDGSVYASGVFQETVSIGTGTVLNGPDGTYNSFVAKFSPVGDGVWIRSVESDHQNDAFDLDVDAAGNVYVTGRFLNTADLDLDAGTEDLHSTDGGSWDTFFVKLDASGNTQWGRSWGGVNNTIGRAVVVDNAGDIVVGGWTNPIHMDLDPDPVDELPVGTSSDDGRKANMWMSKFDTTGDLVWGHWFGSNSVDAIYGLDVDAANNIYATGSAGTTGRKASGGNWQTNLALPPIVVHGIAHSDIVTAKFDPSGTTQWVKIYGGSGKQLSGLGIAVTGDAVYSVGYYNNTVDFSRGVDPSAIANAGSRRDPFLVRHNAADGSFVCAATIADVGSNKFSEAQAVAVDSAGNVYMSGYFNRTVDFDPSTEAARFTSLGNSEGFVARYSPACALGDADVAVAPTPPSFSVAGTPIVVSEAGSTDSVTVMLNTQPTSDVTISVVLSSDSEAGVDVTELTFTPDTWNEPKTVTVTGRDDDVDDGDQDTMMTFSSSGAAAYAALDDQSVTITTVDDETFGFTVSTLAVTVSESGSTATLQIVLDSKPTAVVTVSVTGSDEGEARVAPSTITFTPGDWSVAQDFTITGSNDLIVDENQASTVSLVTSSADSMYAALTAVVNVTTTDNDAAGFTATATDGTTMVSETETSDTIAVVLSTKPTGTVVISVTSSDPSETTVSPAVLTFTPDTWSDAQDVTVKGENDTEDDGDITSTVKLSVVDAASAAEFAPVADVELVVTTRDDDEPAVEEIENVTLDPEVEEPETIVDPGTVNMTGDSLCSAVQVVWALDVVGEVQSFVLASKGPGTGWAAHSTHVAATDRITVGGLADGTHSFRVLATMADGSSALSNVLEANVFSCAPIVEDVVIEEIVIEEIIVKEVVVEEVVVEELVEEAIVEEVVEELVEEVVEEVVEEAIVEEVVEEAIVEEVVEDTPEVIVEEEADDNIVVIPDAAATPDGGEGPGNGTNPEANNTAPGTSGTGNTSISSSLGNTVDAGTLVAGTNSDFSEGSRIPFSSSTLATAAGIAAAAGLGLSGVGARIGTALLRFLSSTGAGLFLIGLFRRDRRPGAPENFVIFSSGQITNLVWTAPTAGKAPERYIVEGLVSGYWREVFEFGTNVCRAGVPTSEIESICNWRLRAANEHGVGKPSNEAILEAGTAEATTDLPMAA